MVEQPARPPERIDVGAGYLRLVAQEPATDQELACLRATSELILNAAGEGIYGLDLQGRCTFVNPAAARMTGHEPQELLGRVMHDVVHHTHTDGGSYLRRCCPIYAATRDGLVRNVSDEVFWRKDGTSFPVEYTSTPLFNGKSIAGAVVVFRDVTLRAGTEARLREALREVQALQERLQFENRSLRREILAARRGTELVGSSPALRRVVDLVTRVAPSDSTVLITGETGTGKELIARSVHELSSRKELPLIQLNCAAIPQQLAESELFGHEKGAFTGADRRRLGVFEQAQGGTVFLDEVGELSLATQAALLRVLQEREVQRVGGSNKVAVDVRVVAATNRDLKHMVAEGTFRSDLYFRLSVVPVFLPPLRQRKADLPLLVEHLLTRLEQKWQRPLGTLSEEALARLSRYAFPGNVRELQNVLEHAALLSDGPVIEVPPNLLEFSVELEPVATRAEAPASRPATSVPHRSTAPQSLASRERDHIVAALEETHWRISGPRGAGALLGVHPNTLRHRMRKHGICR